MSNPKAKIAPLKVSALSVRYTQPDEELVERILVGAVWAEEALYRRYANKVTAFCLRLLRHQADAEDVVQDTFVLAFNKLDTLRDPASFQTWLMQIAVSRMHRLFRRQKLQRLVFRRHSHEDLPFSQQLETHAPQEDRLELALLDKAFDKMTLDERICWVLRYLEEHTIKEIAEITGMSGTSVKRRLSGAVLLINHHLGEDAHD